MTLSVPHPIPYQGSKRKLAPEILKWFPEKIGTLYEPFAGSAAVTLAAAATGHASSFCLGDSLLPLMSLWQQIIIRPHQVADEYERIWKEQLDDPRGYYDEVRDEYNAAPQASLLLFLLARCVKNAVRFNQDGLFNQSPDKRRLGTKPERMIKNIMGAHDLLRGKTRVSGGDYVDTTSRATSDDLIYLDPPYQGTSGSRDQRYYEQLDFDRFTAYLKMLLDRGVPFIISFDGRTGDKEYGKMLPPHLGLTRVELDAGRSTQATLNGDDHRTVESLYLSPTLEKRNVLRPKQITCLLD